MPDPLAPLIPGAEQVVEWFGRWPSFHDAEVLEICLHREGRSWLRLHAWRTTEDVDAAGYHVLDLHAVVTFWFDRVLNLDLADFSSQNVIFGLACEAREGSVRVTMHPCYGVAGYVEAERVSVSLEPGRLANGG